jgi:hypothetical protein
MDREVLASKQRVLGPEHRITTDLMCHLAGLLADQGHLDEADKLFCPTFETHRQTLGATRRDQIVDFGFILSLATHLVLANALRVVEADISLPIPIQRRASFPDADGSLRI